MTRTRRRLDSETPVLDAALRSDFGAFLHKVFDTLCPGQQLEGGWVVRAMAYHVDSVLNRQERRLIVNLPPRSLKSITFSVALPAFALGWEPRLRIICVSYSIELAKKLANDFRAIIESDWYRRIFLGTRIGRFKNTETEIEFTARGYRLAVSVQGTLTGRGGDLIIIDDPIKPTDALSEPTRTGVNQWFLNTLLSRLDNKAMGRIVIVMQRVHVDDLTGFVLAGAEDWTVLKLPAIAEDRELIPIGSRLLHERLSGDVLWPGREPRDVLEMYRRELGSDIFSAQYQQAPMPPEGAMIKRRWVMRYSTPPVRRPGSRVIQSWDTASKGGAENDWSVCTTWLFQDAQYYLLHVHRGRYDYPELKRRALLLAEQHRPTKILIEDTGTGTALAQELRRSGRPAIAVKPEGDKVARMSVQSAKFEAGLVHLPAHASWLAEFEAELFAFPNSRHDDQIDSVSQALAGARGGISMVDYL
jgi:predicted phage terminase large subunit-like protein